MAKVIDLTSKRNDVIYRILYKCVRCRRVREEKIRGGKIETGKRCPHCGGYMRIEDFQEDKER